MTRLVVLEQKERKCVILPMSKMHYNLLKSVVVKLKKCNVVVQLDSNSKATGVSLLPMIRRLYLNIEQVS